jgi:prolipoprotein diacylglyceryltransferase
MSWILANWENILAIYGGVVAVCTTIVKITPSVKDDAVLAKVLKVIDFFSTVFLKSDAEKIAKAEKK